jgi:hypothetical protein
LSRGGCIALVTGEAGIGKTAVVSEFVRRRGPAIRALWGSCDPLSTPQPLGPVRDVGRQVGSALLDVGIELVEPRGSRARALNGPRCVVQCRKGLRGKLMDRREFLEQLAGISALVPGLALLPDLPAFARDVHARAKASEGLRTLNAHQDATVRCIAELLLPETDTIGANSIGVNRFIDLLLTESMLETQRERFLAGLAAIDVHSESLHGTPVVSAGRAQQEALIRALDVHWPAPFRSPAEVAAVERAPITAEGGFALLKRLVVLGYFTSEPVARGIINAPIIPGRYDGCVPV